MHRIPTLFALIACTLTTAAARGENPASAQQSELFAESIQPLLRERCYDCHSHEFEEASGGLVLDSKSGWAVGGDSGPAITPGEADKSLLYRAISYELDGLEMPPGGKLSDEQIELVKRWIEGGAYDPRTSGKAAERKTVDVEAGKQWWAFQPLSHPEIPKSNGDGNAIDGWIDEKLQEHDLQPAPPAEAAVLLRRLHYDLTGLPPMGRQVREFLAAVKTPSTDARRLALTAVVDELLASRQFAEKWGRHWLDLARYADSNGSSFNPPFPQAWRYRNWVIDAFDRGMPIDHFIRMQIAGDLLPYESQQERDENLIATGFLMLGSKVLGLFDKEQLLLDVVDEQIDTISKSLLGMTVACARCHDHKFDPIPQTDYYAIAGIFTSTVTLDERMGGPKADESDWSRRGLGATGDQRLAEFLKEHRHEWTKATQKTFRGKETIAELKAKFASAAGDRREELKQELAKEREALAEWTEKLKQLQHEMPAYAMAVRDVEAPSDEALRIRGVAASKGKIVPRGFLQVASVEAEPGIRSESSGRLELANWITSADNPLTARVFVNRVWKHLFGEGLVRSVDNFGTMGETPSHPELLDYLATRFVESGWQLKPLVREIVLSNAYCRSVAKPTNADPENRLLSHQNRRRLEPEEIRDTLLQLRGSLDLSPGRGMIDHLPIGDVSNLGDALRVSDNRRTVYQPVIRTLEPTVLQVFDAPVNTMTTGARNKTIVAPQALYFLNSESVQATADDLADRLWSSGDDQPLERWVRLAFTEITCRQPTPSELDVLTRYTQAQSDGGHGFTRHDLMKLCQTILASTQFQFLD